MISNKLIDVFEVKTKTNTLYYPKILYKGRTYKLYHEDSSKAIHFNIKEEAQRFVNRLIIRTKNEN